MSEIILQNKDGMVTASSLEVAKKFGKRHDSILRDIDNLIKTDSTILWSEMFIETTYKSRGKDYRRFDMTRDGFSLLAMGFTGSKAIQWKIKYINAFNTMEEKLKSGSYLTEEEKLKLQLFSKDSLEVVSAHNRLLELATAPLIEENKHKQEVINGLTDDVPLYEKTDIINRICKRSYGGYADRYKELYKCFKENFHVDLVRQCENYNDKQEKKKDRLSIIRYAERFGYTDNLYVCCAKLYESEVNSILEEINEIHK
ncbi:Rha family transcriptional regulator [Lacrimispora indolis]|uniref:Rha family transcriptional regulator n=1 Tax=Lacrimispora indolis TaxID=69825 RepID=UPI000421713A|nr:Rha family transcriptional regulator [[Clostridium] methoxybenzovorans]